MDLSLPSSELLAAPSTFQSAMQEEPSEVTTPLAGLSGAIRERLVGYLGANVSRVHAAAACGITEGYVAQLLQEPEFAAAVQRLRLAKLDDVMEVEATVALTEKKALEAIRTKMPFVKSPLDAARIFQILNTVRQRSIDPTAGGGSQAGAQNTVTFTLPKAAEIYIRLNTENQVIEVAGRSMATLPSRALPQLLAGRAKELVEVVTPKPLAPEVATIQQRLRQQDEERAKTIFDDIQTLIGGVSYDL